MAKKSKKLNKKYLFQYHVRVGNFPRVHFYSVSDFQYLSKEAARQAACNMLIKKGINPNKAKIYTNQRMAFHKYNIYSGYQHKVDEEVNVNG